MEEITDRIQRKVEEETMGIKSRANKDLTIFNLTNNEYDAFIKIVKTATANNKGYEALTMLLDAYENAKKVNQIVEYSEELKEKNAKLEARILELENEPKKEKKKYIGGE
jgi:Zn-dependent M32 family carboxypeptidase